ncbi:class II peroxidase [Sphaerobolus stellatus SS14]|uniref:Class II peroxidase n=1 Tax=Sphaerobolus stellatus (strain SS14) TaxID=990650 RepID=A0A0C9T639_SPHS4|nr:class II peroxidase [Sphaerobolus stellatus SS14]
MPIVKYLSRRASFECLVHRALAEEPSNTFARRAISGCGAFEYLARRAIFGCGAFEYLARRALAEEPSNTFARRVISGCGAFEYLAHRALAEEPSDTLLVELHSAAEPFIGIGRSRDPRPAPSAQVVTCPNGNKASNAACCPFLTLRDDLHANLFENQCGEDAHESIHLTFHGAIASSSSLKAKESPLEEEPTVPCLCSPTSSQTSPSTSCHVLPSTQSPQVILSSLQALSLSATATVLPSCNSWAPAPDGLIPQPQHSIKKIFGHLTDGGGFTSDEIIALFASHILLALTMLTRLSMLLLSIPLPSILIPKYL